ncbi:MFS transporter [Massilia sp.]|uniref:MFS transporter n=1 Tax=Massilia sp. TaxID=1882437 RepID=UPI00289D9F36|nr:MFS transporter [Massilia sp.]
MSVGSAPAAPAAGTVPANKPRTVLFASLIGTTIEFYDFYIYATAAVLVFPRLFFPSADPGAAVLQSLATFAIAFFARPIGSAVFGHFGDRIGRKATLVAALLTMGVSTVLIGLLPTYAQVGVAAPLLLALCRFGQGLGLGGEWGGAVLLATENAPPGKRAWYGMFPQLGAPIGFFLSGGTFLLLGELMSDAAFFSYGWRIPFLASALLVAVGLYVRLKITETPDFQKVLDSKARVKVPMVAVMRDHRRALVLGTLIALATFVVFYLMTVFALSWGTAQLGFTRQQFLLLQLFAVIFFALTIPPSALLADSKGRRTAMMLVSGAIALFGLLYGPFFGSGGWVAVTFFMVLGMCLVGFTYGPLGTLLAELFPAEVRYTGASLTFNFASILGASLAPYIAMWLGANYGLEYVGYYLSAAALISLLALVLAGRQTRAA